jgi:hypothetical protein
MSKGRNNSSSTQTPGPSTRKGSGAQKESSAGDDRGRAGRAASGDAAQSNRSGTPGKRQSSAGRGGSSRSSS